MALSRWVVGFSALLLGACGGPVETEAGAAPETTGAVEQRSEEPGGGTRHGYHRTYYFDAAKQQWAGAYHADCSGYIGQSGQVTAYYDEYSFVC